MPGSPTARGRQRLAHNAANGIVLRPFDSVGTPNLSFRGSMAQPARAPIQRFATPSRDVDAWLAAAVRR